MRILVIPDQVFLQEQQFPVMKGPYLEQTPPGEIPQLFAPGVVSTCTQHDAAYFSPDGTEIYFSRVSQRPTSIMIMREEYGIWNPPQVISFSGKYIDLTPFPSPDGKRLYFASNRPLVKGGKPGNAGQLNIWVVEKTETGWSEPVSLGAHINSGRREDTPSVALEGTVYFGGKSDDPQNRSNVIFRSEFINGQYTKRKQLSNVLNSNYLDGTPFISPDESYILFTSFRPGGYGMSDLYISFYRKDGTWTKPENMGKEINTPAKEGYPYVSPEGKYLFFNSNRPSALNKKLIPDGGGNVFWVDAVILKKFKHE